MSRAGAMLDYIKKRVKLVRPNVDTTDKAKIVAKMQSDELPLCMIYAAAYTADLIEFRQREEDTRFAVSYVQEFDLETESPVRSLADTAEAIGESIWDGNALDTDAAGYFARVANWEIMRSSEKATRWALVMEVVFETMDAVDSAFALAEDSS